MADDALEDLVRRLTALVVKLDERDDHILALLEEQREFNREQREFNRQQVQINARLETLVTKLFRERHNGRDA
jgi:predicted transcriptional regulator